MDLFSLAFLIIIIEKKKKKKKKTKAFLFCNTSF